MKEILLRIVSMIIALAITLSLCIIVYNSKNTYKTIIDLADKIDGLKTDYRAPELTNNNKELLDKIEELTRDNERYEMENAALVDYINGFEDKFWKE
jgi:uncharacterized protein YoxC